jgi:hypothetical protein
VELFELFAVTGDPVVVPVLREQLAAIQIERRPVRAGRADASGVDRRVSEGSHVDVCVEHEQSVAKLDCVSTERTAGGMHSLMQVVGRSGRIPLRPQCVHHLFAVQSISACEREHLDQLTRLPQPPRPIGQRDVVDRRREPAEQANLNARHLPSMPGDRAGDRG